MKVVK